eukprot:scaffold870_cov108-Isochrysis_galbana.AAC.1
MSRKKERKECVYCVTPRGLRPRKKRIRRITLIRHAYPRSPHLPPSPLHSRSCGCSSPRAASADDVTPVRGD